VDSPIFPTNGSKFLINYRYSGGILGGSVNMHKLKVEGVQFFPLWKHKHTLGVHLEYEGLSSIGGSWIPDYERFYMGGERSIRGFDIYRIGPKTITVGADGTVRSYNFGGTKSILFQAEYQIPLTQQFSFVFFCDIGNTYEQNRPIDFKNLYQSMGLELKIFIPMLNVPFRLIFAYNPRLENKGDDHFVFRFGIGPSFY
jgi:outer membrane protein insertion porin family